jgi:hypothetical protein
MTPVVGLRALYGGRHLRTTMVLATASAAAGALTGAIGVGVSGTPASHDAPVIPQHTAAPQHHRAATTPPTHAVRLSPTPRKSASRSPKPTPTVTDETAAPPTSAPTASAPQSSGPATPPSTEPASPSASGSPTG